MFSSLKEVERIVGEYIEAVKEMPSDREEIINALITYSSERHSEYLRKGSLTIRSLFNRLDEESRKWFKGNGLAADYPFSLIARADTPVKEIYGYAILYPFGLPRYRSVMSTEPLLQIYLLDGIKGSKKLEGKQAIHLLPYHYGSTRPTHSPLSSIDYDDWLMDRIYWMLDRRPYPVNVLHMKDNNKDMSGSTNFPTPRGVTYCVTPLTRHLETSTNLKSLDNESLASIIYPITDKKLLSFDDAYI